MMQEIREVRQIPGEPRRRWFTGDGLDLIVWYNEADIIFGFQLCFHDGRDQKAITWLKNAGIRVNLVDDGEFSGIKMTPILSRDRAADTGEALVAFEKNAGDIDPVIFHFVQARLSRPASGVFYNTIVVRPPDRGSAPQAAGGA